MTDLEHPQQRWTDWVTGACAAVGIDADQVDIVAIHHLSKQVAHRLERPLAPVSTFILGLALGASAEGWSADELLERILDTLPAETDPDPTD
jgi:hypothetical protein